MRSPLADGAPAPERQKVIGVGLNRTGTKTLGRYCQQWGFRHQSYALEPFELYREGEIARLLESMQAFDSFEDWPWPLMFREIDAHFPEARFVLTVRKDPDTWYRSLCNLAVRMGPLDLYEKYIYGHSMPQGHRNEHVQFYREHNRAVEEHFSDRPGKLLKICWEAPDGDHGDAGALADFLGQERPADRPVHANRSLKVYSGDNLWLAHANRIAFQSWWTGKRVLERLRKLTG